MDEARAKQYTRECETMKNRDLSEEDIKAQYITPTIESAGWDIKSKRQIGYKQNTNVGEIQFNDQRSSRIFKYRKQSDRRTVKETKLQICAVCAKEETREAQRI